MRHVGESERDREERGRRADRHEDMKTGSHEDRQENRQTGRTTNSQEDRQRFALRDQLHHLDVLLNCVMDSGDSPHFIYTLDSV